MRAQYNYFGTFKTLFLLLLLSQIGVADTWCNRTLQYLAEFPDKAKTAVKKYATDVVQSRGRRIILKEHTGEPITLKWYHPIQAINYWVVKKPTRWLTHKWLGKEMDWTIPVYMIGGGIVTAPFWWGYEAAASEILIWKQLRELELNAEQLDALIEYDVRYRDIKQLLEAGELSQEEVQIRALALNKIHMAYFDFCSKNPNTPDKLFLSDPQFWRVKAWSEQGVPLEQPGYRYLPTFSPTLSDSQLGELVKHTQRTLSLFEIAHQWVNDKATLAKVVKKDPAVAKEVAKFDRKNSFAQKLLKRHGEGTLSNWQMLFYLQEDIEWQRNFDEWETLKLQKLKKQNGQYLDQPLTLEDIRKETLDEIDGN